MQLFSINADTVILARTATYVQASRSQGSSILSGIQALHLDSEPATSLDRRQVSTQLCANNYCTSLDAPGLGALQVPTLSSSPRSFLKLILSNLCRRNAKRKINPASVKPPNNSLPLASAATETSAVSPRVRLVLLLNPPISPDVSDSHLGHLRHSLRVLRRMPLNP